MSLRVRSRSFRRAVRQAPDQQGAGGEAAAQRGDALARETAVGLDLGLAGSAGERRAASDALEVGPQPAHPREVVLELRELDLELALGRVRVSGEDVEDHRGAVDDGDAGERV